MICSLTGGFFLLRFINPAVVTPQAYMLVEGSPAKGPRRVLTLVAKLLQNLSNKPSYAKEEYMAVLHPFVEQNTPRIQRFLNDLCEVGDFFESLEVRCWCQSCFSSSVDMTFVSAVILVAYDFLFYFPFRWTST
jgi:Ras GTPase-activating-like protein IQGAP2/3